MRLRFAPTQIASLIKSLLLWSLKDERGRIRANAVHALENFCNEIKVREELERVKSEDKDEFVRQIANFMLAKEKCRP